MIITIDGVQYKTADDEGICISTGIAQSNTTHFGIPPVERQTHVHPDNWYQYDHITFCAHAHCTHTETVNHVVVGSEYTRPSVPLFQLCAVAIPDPRATACLDTYSPNCRHWLTSRPSVDGVDDGGILANHRRHFDTHPLGVITELAAVPPSLPPGLYILMTAIVECPGSDSHPTHLRLFPIQ